MEETLIKDLVLLSFNTIKFIDSVSIPGNKLKEAYELREACSNILKTFTVEFQDEEVK